MRQKQKHPGGRPSKLNDEVIKKLEEAFKRDGTVEESCAYAGISSRAFYDHYNKNKEFSRKIDQAKMFPHIYAKTKYFEALNSSDKNLAFKAALEYLRRRNPERKDKAENTNLNNNTEILNDEDKEILNEIRDKLND